MTYDFKFSARNAIPFTIRKIIDDVSIARFSSQPYATLLDATAKLFGSNLPTSFSTVFSDGKDRDQSFYFWCHVTSLINWFTNIFNCFR